MIVWLNDKEFEQCLTFAQRCALNQQRIEFGQTDTAPRGISEIGRDNMIGKMAEVAFAKMMHNRYGIDIELDFNYYPRGKWDDQDAVINGWLIDVKATRKGGHWMLIEWSKLNFRQKQHKLSHLYVMASVDWDRSHDLPQREVDLIGCASITKLLPSAEKTVVLPKGSCIPHTHTRLQADNYGINFSDLETDWDKVMRYILNHKPPDLSSYPNPYTGKPLPPSPDPVLYETAKKPVYAETTHSQPKPWWRKLSSWIKKLFTT